MNENTTDELVTLEEFEEMLQVSRSTAYHLLNSGEICAFKIGRCWKIPRMAVTRYIENKSSLALM